MMVVKIFQHTDNHEIATLTTKDGSTRYQVPLDDTLRNKMCRRKRAYFRGTFTSFGDVAIHERLPNQHW